MKACRRAGRETPHPWGRRLNPIKKYVFSSRLETVNRENSTIVRGNVAVEVAKIKETMAQISSCSGMGCSAKRGWRRSSSTCSNFRVYDRCLADDGEVARRIHRVPPISDARTHSPAFKLESPFYGFLASSSASRVRLRRSPRSKPQLCRRRTRQEVLARGRCRPQRNSSSPSAAG
jgi:hypothetical protein